MAEITNLDPSVVDQHGGWTEVSHYNPLGVAVLQSCCNVSAKLFHHRGLQPVVSLQKGQKIAAWTVLHYQPRLHGGAAELVHFSNIGVVQQLGVLKFGLGLAVGRR
eukprot:CAMPEP_0206287236 /NCGR_PEP_ID=MMETSP0106_2-20121207/1005_1 /ASSEMBLY_ACC=CAM_ASM_000206 /TAXON_ID=81532 /ORGANISM="Acanthoeca-like sp., Strain 10tr" /LENGTH=105 /DNA_ID=CAMNT_0053717769 /DNA_START=384 /DNA_END=701 /DNA_ORIENTATION=+